MRSDDWHTTGDITEFLAHAGDFLRSQPARHTTPLTTIEKLRTQGTDAVFGWLGRGNEVSAFFYHRPNQRLTVSRLSAEESGALAARLAGVTLSGVTAENDTAAAFSEAWQRLTGAAAVPTVQVLLYRLGTLTPPEPVPAGWGRVAEPQDHEQVVRWCDAFRADVEEAPAESWAVSRFADKQFTFWETPDRTPVSMAGSTRMVGGMVRVDPVYTPAHLRGLGYAGAVTVEVSRAALAAGATDVVLFTNPANTTSNALYQRIGYVPVTSFTGYDFL
ncbi:GNAT family N-acetyltransferase [Actinocrispum sp. NPDC049592]|uniref:GNAT family N-acetyltransferase n=1 Tax=Actinocrispum sp. NPDC049592 TaxID=3154835 RepID=UPI00341701FC